MRLVLKQGPMRGVSVWAYRERPSGHLFPGVGDGIHEVAPLATEGKVMRPPFVVSLLAVALLAVAFAALPSSEAPTGFDNQSNGMVDDATHQADQVKFDEVENVSDGLGPLYNAQSCRECHQSPVSGGVSQVAELRVGHEGAHHRFENAEIPIARGTEIITGRTLVNDRAICPNGAFPNTEIQERLPDSENVRTTRLSPAEVTKLCNTASEPNDVPDPDGLDDLALRALHPRYQGAGARRATGSDTANQARLRAVREGRLCHLPRARFDHRTRRNQDQWWEIHHFRRAGSEDLPSLFGFPDAQRGDG